ncbi:hypothetical protein EBB59_07410 [Lysobacter pythonis]|uniref:Uncharacterized protein n=2 Tax=Solilutibacter pythonis TaxID=2483112 RepID=A0A3M2HXP9_9GAMM|nr:hypothetical protein EBB59_07410 [Lysobacter pythonis]
MPHRPPLDAEERQLAAQLARIAPRGEPSAELDARILALAGRTADENHATAQPPRRKHWPVWLGMAASLSAVAGFLWQVHPILSPAPEIGSPMAVASADASGDATEDDRQPIAYVRAPANVAVTEPAPPAPPPSVSAPAPKPRPARPSSRRNPTPASPHAQTEAAAPSGLASANRPKRAPPISADLEGPPEIVIDPAPHAYAPLHAEHSGTTNAAAQARPREVSIDRAQAGDSRIAPPPPAALPAAAAARHSPPLDRASAGDFDERPPVSAATPQMQKAWLERIRALKADGRLEEARASLKEFILRNPKADIPADLKPLLPAPPVSP